MMMSMTGFGRASFALDGWGFGVELRSVNNRFLDVKVSLPWPNADVEHELRARLRSRFSRGRIDLAVRVVESQNDAPQLALNAPLARALAKALAELAETLGGVDVATAATLVPAQRDLLSTGAPAAKDSAQILAALLPGFEEAIDGLAAMRRTEGAALAEDLRARIGELQQLAEQMARIAAVAPEVQTRRLQERLARLTAEVSADRLAQEVALLADRCDVNEELTRLDSHLEQLRTVCAAEGPKGRKIEFLLQELNREVNTVGSKSAHGDMSALVVEAKCCLERMREQAQNVE